MLIALELLKEFPHIFNPLIVIFLILGRRIYRPISQIENINRMSLFKAFIASRIVVPLLLLVASIPAIIGFLLVTMLLIAHLFNLILNGLYRAAISSISSEDKEWMKEYTTDTILGTTDSLFDSVEKMKEDHLYRELPFIGFIGLILVTTGFIFTMLD